MHHSMTLHATWDLWVFLSGRHVHPNPRLLLFYTQLLWGQPCSTSQRDDVFRQFWHFQLRSISPHTIKTPQADFSRVKNLPVDLHQSLLRNLVWALSRGGKQHIAAIQLISIVLILFWHVLSWLIFYTSVQIAEHLGVARAYPTLPVDAGLTLKRFQTKPQNIFVTGYPQPSSTCKQTI